MKVQHSFGGTDIVALGANALHLLLLGYLLAEEGKDALAVTGKPIKYVGMGEKLDDFEPFHPERMASRILGMGDVLTLIEKAESTVNEKDARKLAQKLEENKFDMNDLLDQLRQIQKMGSLKSIIGMLPV